MLNMIRHGHNHFDLNTIHYNLLLVGVYNTSTKIICYCVTVELFY